MPTVGMMSLVSACTIPASGSFFRNNIAASAVDVQFDIMTSKSCVCAIRENISQKYPKPFVHGATRVTGINSDLTFLRAARSGCNQRKRNEQPRRQMVVRAQGLNELKPEVEERSIQLYGQIERVYAESARRSRGPGGDEGRWQQVEGCWVLRPNEGVTPVAVAHFVGGAFVGASPQLTYRLFLETLAKRGVVVVATPFATGFDHLKIADEALFKFDRCVRAMRAPDIDSLPVFGLGHSLGALTHVIIGSRYAVSRRGNILLSFNNKEVTAAMPNLSPVILPFARDFGPLLQNLSANPTLKKGADLAFQNLMGSANSPFMEQVLPLLAQLPPLYQDLQDGKNDFLPSPAETDQMVKAYYGVGQNLLVRFRDDSIDESLHLAQVLRGGGALGRPLDVEIKTLAGDHARPLQQMLPDLPENLVNAVSQGSSMFTNLAGNTPFGQLAQGLMEGLESSMNSGKQRATIEADIETLVDEISDWMGAARRPALREDPSRWIAG